MDSRLREPLLQPVPADEESAVPQIQQKQEHVQQQQQEKKELSRLARSTFLNCTFNLAKVITGAGMMSIPKAYSQIGWLMGNLLLSGVAVLTYFTLAVLVQGTQSFKAATYPKLVLVACGRRATTCLQLAVLAFLFGFNVVYLVVIKDILLGSNNNGLLAELFGLPASSIWVQPHLVLLLIALLCAPLLLMRSMSKLAVFNVVGVAATILLAGTAAALGLTAVAQGTAYPIPLLPQWQLLGPTKVAQLEALTEVAPVVLACYVAHQSLHPLMPLLKPYSPRRMCLVVASALVMVFLIFLSLSVGASLAFGPTLDGNVLNNISETGMTPLVGPDLARVLSLVIRGGYALSLVANLLLYVHPLRSYVAEIIWPEKGSAASAASTADAAAGDRGVAAAGGAMSQESPAVCTLQDATVQTAFLSAEQEEQQQQQQQGYVVAADPACAASQQQETGIVAQPPLLRWQRNEQRWYYALTYTELSLIVMCAICVPNIYVALSAIGDLASTIQAFVIPGLIALCLARHRAQLLHKGARQQQDVAAAAAEAAAAAIAASTAVAGTGGDQLSPESMCANRSPAAEDVGCAGGSTALADAVSDELPPAAEGRRSGGKGTVIFFSSFRVQTGAGRSKLRQVMQEAFDVSADWLELAVLRGLGGLVVGLGVALFVNGIVQRL